MSTTSPALDAPSGSALTTLGRSVIIQTLIKNCTCLADVAYMRCYAEVEVCLKTRNRTIVILFSLALSFSVSRAGAETTHGGTISSDETWTLADSPHRVVSGLSVTGKVTIEPGATVTINAETAIGAFGSGSIWAVGTPDKPIRFKSYSGWQAITLMAEVPSEFRYCHFSGEGSVFAYTSSPLSSPSHLFQHCLFQNAEGLQLVRSSARVLNSMFTGRHDAIVVTISSEYENELPTIRHNAMKDGGIALQSYDAVDCGGVPFIQDNRITGSCTGLKVYNQGPIYGLVISDCSFNCATGISLEGGAVVDLTVQQCDIAPSGSVTVGGVLGSGTRNFANNYWGVTNAALVDASLFAGALDEAAFTPFATNSCFRQADVDGSAFGNATGLEDATLVKEHLVGLRQLSAAQQEIADVDNDGDVDVRDALMIESFVKGTLWRLPVR